MKIRLHCATAADARQIGLVFVVFGLLFGPVVALGEPIYFKIVSLERTRPFRRAESDRATHQPILRVLLRISLASNQQIPRPTTIGNAQAVRPPQHLGPLPGSSGNGTGPNRAQQRTVEVCHAELRFDLGYP